MEPHPGPPKGGCNFVLSDLISFLLISMPKNTSCRRRFSRFFASVVTDVRRFGGNAAAKASLLGFDEALATNGWDEGPSTTEAGLLGFGLKEEAHNQHVSCKLI
jgi:hypothetical protein